eukprot:Tbor_TRINITY_DN3893_c0_g1::TRINITY_DN3893_c0_g1_i1::g.5629::m.5629
MHIITTFFKVKKIPGSIIIGGGYCDPTAPTPPTTITAYDSAIRAKEYVECIQRNITPEWVKGLHLIAQDDQSIDELVNKVIPSLSITDESSGRDTNSHMLRKIIATRFPRAPEQPLYSDLFEYANRYLKGQIVMVCNADIFVKDPWFQFEDIKKVFLKSEADEKKLVLGLTRYENDHTMEAPLIDDYQGSHDAFVFKSPIQASPKGVCNASCPFLNGVKHRQNCYKAENIVIHELIHTCNATVVNPCKDVRIFHKHEAHLRQWMPPVDEIRYGRAFPCFLKDIY